MNLEIFAIRDRASDSFGNPMFLLALGQAIRSFSDEINRSAADNNLYLHPDDFDLFHLGSFDTSSAQFSLLPSPSQIAIGKNLKLNGSSPGA